MGGSVDTVTEPMTPDQRAALVKTAEVKLPAAEISGEGATFILSHKPNAAFQLVNAVLAQGGSVGLVPDMPKTAEGPERGAFAVTGLSRAALNTLTGSLAISAVATPAPAHTIPLKAARIGLYRPWNPSIDEGWTRWILENYHFSFKSLYNADIRSANLRGRYDAIIVPDMSANQLMNGFPIGSVPGQYAGGLGQDGLNNLREFVQSGGTLIAFNQTAAAIIPLMSLPVKNVLGGLPNDKFFCAGALLRVQTEHPELPANFGLPAAPVVMFERGPAFETLPGFKGAVLARYAKQADPLESGMILHADMLAGKAAAIELAYGRGRILLFGFKPQHRGQAHGTYRYFFNALYLYENFPYPMETDPPPPAKSTAAPTAKAAEDEDDEP